MGSEKSFGIGVAVFMIHFSLVVIMMIIGSAMAVFTGPQAQYGALGKAMDLLSLAILFPLVWVWQFVLPGFSDAVDGIAPEAGFALTLLIVFIVFVLNSAIWGAGAMAAHGLLEKKPGSSLSLRH